MRRLAFLSYLSHLLPLLLLALTLSARGQSQAVTVEDGKVSLLQSIFLNTTWPQEQEIDRFIVGLYGRDNALLRVLQREMPEFRVRDKRVAVTSYNSLTEARAAHILVVAPSENGNLAKIDQALHQSQTLIVTDDADDKRHIMVNFTHPSRTRLSFEINGSNIVYAGLNLSKDMLLFGGTKLDVAAFYEEAEAELVRAKAMTAQQQQQLKEQQALLDKQEATIARQLEEVTANQQKLAALERQLSNAQQVLSQSERRLRENQMELVEKENILAEKEAFIESYSEKIEKNQQRLETQQKELLEQERQIAEQDSVLLKQVSTIESQRFILFAAAAVLLLVLTLIVIIFRGYRSKHRLNLQLEGKTNELAIANEKLVQVTEAKSRFLSAMSHEIRTPMNGVIGMAELLEGTDLSTPQREYVSLIIKSADTLLGLINDILDFSKIEAGRLDLEAIPFNLREILGDTLQTMALRANEKGLELTFHIPPEVPDRLIGDPLRLRQVVVNLVGNAIKFTESGEVAVDLQLESVSNSAARVHIEVRDTGIGISEAQQKKIFQAFDQADSSTTRQFGGTGLGLSIARQLTEMMGGEMAVRSELGKGSTFFFGADFQLPEGPVPAPLRPEELRGQRALVVDDNSTNCMILEELLRNWGMLTSVFNSGEKALAELERTENGSKVFSLALLDVMMPNMDGYELAHRIRQHPAHKEMRIILLTSAGRLEREAGEDSDISRVLMKPIKHSDLLSAITDALGVASIEQRETASQRADEVAARKVLLVEDNPVNQKVAVELLSKRGHIVEVARNGEEAVKAVISRSFDVVLMDVHMPVMDGLTATRIIREQEHASGSHMPIVALTAGATVEDRENCLSAGMNDFVSKPFRADELFRAVEIFPAEQQPEVTGNSEPTPEPTGDSEPCLAWEDALRNLEGDEELLYELAEMFLAQCPRLLEAVEKAVSDVQADELRRAAHSLKGSAQVIGGRATAAAALSLENLGRSKNLGGALPALSTLQASLDELKTAVSSALKERETA